MTRSIRLFFAAILGLSMASSGFGARERVSINDGWRFMKYESAEQADDLIYDVRPEFLDDEDGKAADAKPTEAVEVEAKQPVLKDWILPTANAFIKDPAERHVRPDGNPGSDFPFVQSDFDDSAWEAVTLPHDWAIAGPFMEGHDAPVGGGMGRLPSPGVAWYRKALDVPSSDKGKSIFLDIDGAMSYAMVWCNGSLVGGWPYGYASWQVDLTPYLRFGGENQIAIRVDNPPASSRWYPGGGLYRNVWLSKTNPVRVGQWGTYVTTPKVSSDAATVNLEVTIDNDSAKAAKVSVETDVYAIDENGELEGGVVVSFDKEKLKVAAHSNSVLERQVIIENPRLWGPYPTQTPNRYVAITSIRSGKKLLDRYETRFGIRELRFDGEEGFFINGESVYFQGVNQHHDLGALGAAFNVRAAERQLEILREMGCNAIRMAHNPPAAELLELTDRMGFLVIDEIFDCWERKKTPLDFHLIFPEWSEPDMRAFLRRDRNNPSVIMWSIGNEVGEQYTGDAGVAVAQRLQDIVEQEDPTRPTAASFNFAKPDMPITAVTDSVSLNYQGEGIRNAPAYAHLKGINTPPLYPKFHDAYPDKLIVSSENAAAVSSRGEYLFPVAEGISAPVADGAGGNPVSAHVSSYELYTAPFGSSADKVLGSLARHPYVGGGFIWSGWDYLGEPTPYYSARSSYFGVIDLAGFKKDRFYLYQAAWRPDFPMAHILPHWNWPDRVGEVTPVHVFTSGDDAELFLNGKSLGRKSKGEFEYRIRWDDVVYEPGELKVVAFKDGTEWASEVVQTTGSAAKLELEVDRSVIAGDGEDLSFVTVRVLDENGRLVPHAKNALSFSVEGPGEIVATDNGDPTSLVSFHSHERAAFNGLCLVIVKAKPGEAGEVRVKVTAEGLASGIAALSVE
ncbi:Glycosyl hydrolases family 2, immunoglobulin-like beta-sandwich domain [Verrucomicrobiia bacterium DG1235]|nr:Glycosyl hydrolases family 2, immunoglobulin-like beta-sandwich domain [Verrucomicrobiae bacterium DG1235]